MASIRVQAGRRRFSAEPYRGRVLTTLRQPRYAGARRADGRGRGDLHRGRHLADPPLRGQGARERLPAGQRARRAGRGRRLLPLVGHGPAPSQNAVEFRTRPRRRHLRRGRADARPQPHDRRRHRLPRASRRCAPRTERCSSSAASLRCRRTGGVPRVAPPPGGEVAVLVRAHAPETQSDDAAELSQGQVESINPTEQAPRLGGGPVFNGYAELEAAPARHQGHPGPAEPGPVQPGRRRARAAALRLHHPVVPVRRPRPRRAVRDGPRRAQARPGRDRAAVRRDQPSPPPSRRAPPSSPTATDGRCDDATSGPGTGTRATRQHETVWGAAPEPLGRAGGARPAARPRARPGLRRGAQRAVARLAGLAGARRRLLRGRGRQGARAGRSRRRVGRRRRHHVRLAGAGRPRAAVLPAGAGRRPARGGAARRRGSRAGRPAARRRAPHPQPHRRHRRPAARRGALHARRHRGRPRRHRAADRQGAPRCCGPSTGADRPAIDTLVLATAP